MKNAYWNNIFTHWGKEESENVTITKKIPIFANLNHNELEEVSKLLHDRGYKPDEYVFKRHAPGEGMFIIHSGIVNIIVGEASGNSQVLAELSNGDFFGEMALLEDEVRSAAALAKDHSKLLGFFRPDLEALIEVNPSLGKEVAFDRYLGLSMHFLMNATVHVNSPFLVMPEALVCLARTR